MYNGKNDRLIFQFHVKNVSSSERAGRRSWFCNEDLHRDNYSLDKIQGGMKTF